MRPEEIRKLLGGYATGSLTPEEQQALFAAAMDDQQLFDALANEQALRDLLRDPAARGELLAALDRPASGFAAFWQWLRQPMVAGVVTACFLGVAGVAVWRGTRPIPDRVIVADLRQEESRAPRSMLPAPESPQVTQAPQIAPAPKLLAPPSAEKLKRAGQQGALENEFRLAAPAAPLGTASGGGGALRSEPATVADNAAPAIAMAKKEVAAIAPAAPPAPAPPPAAAAPAQVKADAIAVTAESAAVQAQLQGTRQALDARSIFYLEQGAVSGFVDSTGAGPQRVPATTFATTGSAAVLRPGVRVSILRGDQEADTTAVLNAGESVRLKLIPNSEGFLRVTEGQRVIASGAAHRMQAFETPPLVYTNAGARQLVITFSRSPLTGGAARGGSAGRSNVVERSADQGRATYVVSNTEFDGNDVVVPVTLNYR